MSGPPPVPHYGPLCESGTGHHGGRHEPWCADPSCDCACHAGTGWPESGDLPGLHALVVRHIRAAHEESDLTDRNAEVLAARVTAIEEVYAARWPRRWLLAARLRRRLRAATRNILAGGSFADRRAEDASLAVHPGPRPGGPRWPR